MKKSKNWMLNLYSLPFPVVLLLSGFGDNSYSWLLFTIILVACCIIPMMRMRQRRMSNSKGNPETTTYTCPMHPEVTSDKPGKCPKCGMNLEKVQ